MFWTIIVGLSLLSYEGSVARVRTVVGDAMVLPYGAEDWEYLVKNDIISEGDMVKTLYDSRLVFEFGRGNVVSLDEDTKIEIIRLDDDFVFRLQTGRARVMTREASGKVIVMNTEVNIYEYSTVRVQKEGAIAKASVIRGEAEIEGEIVRAGEMARIYPDGKIVIRREFLHDDFDSWAARYERRYIVVHEVYYLPDDIYIGVCDLDAYGHWRYIPGYGWVWIPDVGPDWRPYYYGHWVFRVRIGWVWVSYEEWGWIPYHYGRWAWVSGVGWVWVPGSVWRGAWVVWYEGPGWVSWAPLDPYGRPIHYITYRGKRRWIAPVVDRRSFQKPVYRYKPPKNGVYKKPIYKTVKVKLDEKVLKKFEKPVLPEVPIHVKPVFREKWVKKARLMEKHPEVVTRPVFKEKVSVRKGFDGRKVHPGNAEEKEIRRPIKVGKVKGAARQKKVINREKDERIHIRPPKRIKNRHNVKARVLEDRERDGRVERGRRGRTHIKIKKKGKKGRERDDRSGPHVEVDSMRKRVNNKLAR